MQANVTLEYHDNLPPDIEIVKSADGRAIFWKFDDNGSITDQLTFSVRNKRTDQVYCAVFKPLPFEQLDQFREVLINAIAQVQEPC